jgi:hypothetical protein
LVAVGFNPRLEMFSQLTKPRSGDILTTKLHIMINKIQVNSLRNADHLQLARRSGKKKDDQ